MGKSNLFRVIVSGSRSFNNYKMLESTLDYLLNGCKKQIIIVSGMAKGADSFGRVYAERRGYPVDEHPANWKDDGKSAGYIRNTEMAKCADALVAFWDGVSPGTAHMIDEANRFGLKVRVVRF